MCRVSNRTATFSVCFGPESAMAGIGGNFDAIADKINALSFWVSVVPAKLVLIIEMLPRWAPLTQDPELMGCFGCFGCFGCWIGNGEFGTRRTRFSAHLARDHAISCPFLQPIKLQKTSGIGLMHVVQVHRCRVVSIMYPAHHSVENTVTVGENTGIKAKKVEIDCVGRWTFLSFLLPTTCRHC